jgi:hypothetical protein
MLTYLWARLREAWPVNRVVAALTPIVFVPAAGFIATWVAVHFPGLPPIDPGWLTGIFVAGALTAGTTAYKWLDGWQKHEFVTRAPGVRLGGDPLDHPASSDIHPDDAVPDIDDLDGEKGKAAEAERLE